MTCVKHTGTSMKGAAKAFLSFCNRTFQLPSKHAEEYTYSIEALDKSHIATPIKLGHEAFFEGKGYKLKNYDYLDYSKAPI